MTLSRLGALLVWALVGSLGVLTACDGMHSTYDEFVKDGEIVYPATPDSVATLPGKNRLLLRIVLPADPTVTEARVFWNTGRDSLRVGFSSDQDTADVIVDGLEEGSKAFNIHTYDDRGNESVPFSVVGRVYGETYENNLLPRFIENTTLNDSLVIEWGDPEDTSIGSRVFYEKGGQSETLFVENEEDRTVIQNFEGDQFEYTTLYKPVSTSIDTFSSPAEVVMVN